MITRIIFLIIFVCFSGLSFAKKRSFSLKEEQKSPLVSLLDEVVYLHKVLYLQKEDEINVAVLKVMNQIKVVENLDGVLSDQQQIYMRKLLTTLKPKLEKIKNTQKLSQKSINSVNRTFTYMAHVYGLKKYSTFFCSADRSVWMQKKSVNNNKPLHLEHQLCGSVVRR